MIGLILLAVCNVGLALLVAPFFDGLMRKITALVQSRKGPPLTQSYMDIAKLLIKEDIEVGHSPVMQRFSALLSLSSVLAVVLFLPITGLAPIGKNADAILMIYLLSLVGISVLLAALSAGSTYSLVGMSREMMSMMALEPLFAVTIVMTAVKTGSLRLDAIFSGAAYSGGPVSGFLMLAIMLFAFQAFVGRAPFDTTEAETEIMEGPLIEYSGPKLALFRYSHMIKTFVYAGLFTAIFIPGIHTGARLADLALFLGCQFGFVILATLIAATHARYRIDQAVRFYAFLFAAAVATLVVSLIGW
ncbi:MAG: NADH-quinone oxidoreductase subunit H [Chitinispirillaceae bacterium]|jgi:formate hydrogenlyase subunit 4|nr:NADH-quinone oxidoreductase subunit H [Chitinispirillaceae bacterium]